MPGDAGLVTHYDCLLRDPDWRADMHAAVLQVGPLPQSPAPVAARTEAVAFLLAE